MTRGIANFTYHSMIGLRVAAVFQECLNQAPSILEASRCKNSRPLQSQPLTRDMSTYSYRHLCNVGENFWEGTDILDTPNGSRSEGICLQNSSGDCATKGGPTMANEKQRNYGEHREYECSEQGVSPFSNTRRIIHSLT